jgi:HAD superfamily hydrolase (TIGR01509 family)
MFKNIIFDWTGVIKDAAVSHLWVVNKMFVSMGLKEISFSELRENWEEPYMLFWSKYLSGLTLEKEQELYRKTLTDPDYPEPSAYKNIVGLIKKFRKKGILINVLSADLKDIILPEIEKFGLSGVFGEVIVNVHDKTEAIDELIKRNNFEPAETIFIGDSNNEIEAGKKVGIKTATVTWGLNTEEKLKSSNPDFIIHNLNELENLILK